ncbi:sensor domain-containing diguanylate cyclase [Ferrimonas balearica]|uniref:sensor domain-containing diguanylate cyclase n=1 Tax=Ferrimonas balearica TaxID=44012 RepID=UPI001C9630A8|nr:diguanylate cyclase [Ferrimonas balearica]MBY5979476.1 diguanylate cyclase [Ferrimonas balearica]
MGKRGRAPYRILVGRFATATLLGALGFWINCHPTPLFSNIELVLGNTLILLCASRLGLAYTLWCAALAISGLAMTWGNFYIYLTYGLEALVVWQLRRRGWYLLYADFFYWCLIGMPLTALLIQQFFTIPTDYQLVTVVKQGFNGLLYTALASLISLLLPAGWFRRIRQQPHVTRNFREKLVHAVLVMLSLVFMVSMLVASRNMVVTHQQLLASNLHERSAHLVHEYHRYLDYHQRVVSLAGQWFSNGIAPSQWQARLNQLHRQNAGFLTMLVADESGQVIAASPGQHLLDGASGLNVADRHYFTVPMNEHRPYLSDLLQGRGFGQDPIIAISAPIMGPGHRPIGIVEGSLDLAGIAAENDQSHWGDVTTVLTDATGRIVFASEGLRLNILARFEYQELKQIEGSGLALMNIHSTSLSVGEYFYHQVALDQGWQLYVLLPYRPMAERMETYFLVSTALLVVGMLLAVLLTRQISAYLTAPLEFLAEKLTLSQGSEDPLSRLPALPRGSASEIRTLFDELDTNRIALKAYQDSLEQLVTTRTAQLEAANQKLAQQAHRDGLTGAYNRRYFDLSFEVARQHCVRSGSHLALALIDIDHFKSINDTHGHLVGDDCLKNLVSLIHRYFGRKLDLLARYGGEEFVLLLPQSDADEVLRRLESLRRKVAQSAVSESADGEPLYITISIGVLVTHPQYSSQQSDWLMAADSALYQAKSGGRNRLCRAATSDQSQPIQDIV